MIVYRVHVEDTQESFEVAANDTILAAAERAKIKLPHECTLGGCGTCRIKLAQGAVRYENFPMALSLEEAEQGYALACQAQPTSDLVISVPRFALTEPTRQQALITDLSAYGPSVIHLS